MFLSLSVSAGAEEIQIGVLVGSNQRTPFDQTFKRFTRETGITVRTVPSQDAV